MNNLYEFVKEISQFKKLKLDVSITVKGIVIIYQFDSMIKLKAESSVDEVHAVIKMLYHMQDTFADQRLTLVNWLEGDDEYLKNHAKAQLPQMDALLKCIKKYQNMYTV